MILVYGICARLDLRPEKFLSRALALFGQCSMGIYVMHIIVIGFIRLILLKYLHLHNEYLLLIGISAGAIVIPFAIQVAAIKLNLDRVLAMPASGNLVRRPNWAWFGARAKLEADKYGPGA
jgi:peptidoglycan/LPS O-acetylase OafA/YrhL